MTAADTAAEEREREDFLRKCRYSLARDFHRDLVTQITAIQVAVTNKGGATPRYEPEWLAQEAVARADALLHELDLLPEEEGPPSAG